MDRRRRFVPSTEGLEDRALQSGILGSTSNVYNGYYNVQNPTLTQPYTPQEKAERVAHLPFYLNETQPGRFLPASTLTQLQADLNAISGKLIAPSAAVLNNFNLQIRAAAPSASLSPQIAQDLNRTFGAVLHSAGATPEDQARLQADMNDLALIDSHDRNPVLLATNDYSTVLQVALGIGRPIRTPAAPALAPSDVVGGGDSHVTSNRQPRLVGTYDPNATIQLLNVNNSVMGTTVVGKGGKYAVIPSVSLGNGTYTVHVQGIESNFASPPSPTYTFRVVSHGGR